MKLNKKKDKIKKTELLIFLVYHLPMKTDAIEIAIVSVNVTETVIDVVIDLDHTIASVQQVRVAVVIIIDVLDHH